MIKLQEKIQEIQQMLNELFEVIVNMSIDNKKTNLKLRPIRQNIEKANGLLEKLQKVSIELPNLKKKTKTGIPWCDNCQKFHSLDDHCKSCVSCDDCKKNVDELYDKSDSDSDYDKEESDLDENDDMEFNKWKYSLKNKKLYHLEQTILKLQKNLAEEKLFNTETRKKIILLENKQ
jgi:hypothetical protein